MKIHIINTIDKILNSLQLKKENWKERTVFWNSYKARPGQTGDSKTSAVRKGDYKLLQFVENEMNKLKEEMNYLKEISLCQA